MSSFCHCGIIFVEKNKTQFNPFAMQAEKIKTLNTIIAWRLFMLYTACAAKQRQPTQSASVAFPYYVK